MDIRLFRTGWCVFVGGLTTILLVKQHHVVSSVSSAGFFVADLEIVGCLINRFVEMIVDGFDVFVCYRHFILFRGFVLVGECQIGRKIVRRTIHVIYEYNTLYFLQFYHVL